MTHRLNTHTASASALPAPDADAQAHSERLHAVISERIQQAGGAVSFCEFMHLALYAPGLGYYSAGSRKLGADGDFVTAPEISSLFGRTLARAVGEVLAVVSDGDVLEVGAGSGALAAELLAALARHGTLPRRYFILETSPDLRQRQREYLRAQLGELSERVQWLNDFPAAGFRGVVVANELLDALPVHRFCIAESGPQELYVAEEKDAFALQMRPLRDARLAQRLASIETLLGQPLPEGYCSEINLAAEDWVRALGERLEQAVVLISDYGYPRAHYYHRQREMGTLTCHYRHRVHDDALVLVGLQDITAHVDFTAVAEAATEAGMEVCGYTTQAHFLLGGGLMEEAAALGSADVEAQLRVANQIKRLTLPQEMGESFKVMGLARNVNVPLPGFVLRDLRHSL